MILVLAEAIALLDGINDDRCRPDEAQARLADFRARHVGCRLDLVWQQESYDGSFHYDLVVRSEGRRTVSLAVAPEAALPWPLRGAARTSELDLVRVNQVTLQIDQALICLDAIWDQPELLRRLVDTCLVDEALAEDPITLAPAQVQSAMDAFRRGKGLLTTEATAAWMAERSLSRVAFEELAKDQATLAELRVRIVNGRVEDWFVEHRDALATATVAWCECSRDGTSKPTPGDTADMLDLIADAHRNGRAGGIDRMPLSEVRGDRSGPVRVGDHWPAIARIVQVHPAELDESTRRMVEGHIWEEWLSLRRGRARIEWLWGDARRTAAV